MILKCANVIQNQHISRKGFGPPGLTQAAEVKPKEASGVYTD
jgi:hypothetical protein